MTANPPKDTPKDQKLSTKAAGAVSIAVMCSRLLGLIREQVFAALFGASTSMDAFIVAFRTPNLLRDLFAEGALSTAFITTFSKKIASESDASAWRLANKAATLTTVFMSGITLLGILFAKQIVWLLARGFEATPGKFELAVHLTQIMFPFILMVSLAALVMGMLNAKNVFGMPAMASTFFNLGSIIGGVALGWLLDPKFGTKEYGSASLVGLSIGTLIGGAAQLVVQFPALARVGFKFRPDFGWRDEGVRQILLLMGPAVIAASAVQVNVMVNGNFASHLGNGPVSWLNYAFRLMQLPIGIFGVAIGTVTLPVVSRCVAQNDTAGVRRNLARGIRLACLLTIPCAIGLWFFSEPIISLIFERRRFTFADTLQTAAALKFYAIGLVAYSGIKVLAPAFYAIDKRNAPMMVSFFSIATNYALNQIFTFNLHWGHRGLAFSVGLVATINFLILYVLMSRHVHGLETATLWKTLAKLAVAGAALAGVCIASQRFVFNGLEHMAFMPKLAGVLSTIFVAAAVFGAAIYLLKIDEVHDLAQMLKRRFARRQKS
jgi:putative peptidoglycan lipid II flippase